MLIKLTNVAKEHKGKPLLLNPRYIVSVFPTEDEDNKKITVVYGALQNSWSVKETADEIYGMLNTPAEGG